MKNLIENKYFKAFFFLSPLLLMSVLIFFINKTLGDRFINILDSAILFTKTEIYKRFFTLWIENDLGYKNSLYVGINFFSHLYSFILLKLNLSIKHMELVIYFIAYTGIFYSSWYAFYLIQKRVFNEKNNIIFPFLTAFFYSYNIYNISLIGVIDQLFLLQVLYPYLLYILIALLDENINLKYILALGLIIGFTINVPIFSFAVYLCLFLPFIFLKKKILNIKNILAFVLVFIFAFLLTSPLIYALIHGYTASDPYSNVQYNHVGFIFPPYGIMGIFQFFFHWTVTYFDNYFNLYFKGSYGLVSSYLIWVLILTILVIYWRSIKNKKVFLFLMFSLVLTMFLCKGGQPPFEELNMLIYNSNPLFVIFRTPGSKFGQPIMLVLSVLILYILNINKKKILLIIIIVTIFMQTWVFFNPINFIGEENAWWNKSLVKISQDYKNLISLFNNDKKSGTIIFYPGLSNGHYDLKNGTVFSFQDVLGKYIERPIIYPDTDLQFTLAKESINKIIKTFNPKLIGGLSIRYIVIRKDFDIRRLNKKAEVNMVLRIIKNQDFKEIYSSRLFTVFEVNDKYFKEIITIRTPSQEYTPTLKKIAPYHYVVNTKIKDILGNQIVFRNNFHPDWRILDLEKKGLKAKQVLVDNFANGWNIEALDKKNPPNPNQDIVLDIYFYPQKILFYLSVVSAVSLVFFGAFTSYLFLKKIKKFS